MSLIDRIKDRLNPNGGTKTIKKKVTRKDLEAHNAEISKAMEVLEKDIIALTDQVTKADFNTESGVEKYSRLKFELNEKRTLYAGLQTELSEGYDAMKKLRDSGRTELVLKCIACGSTVLLSGLTLIGARDNPVVIKLIEFINKMKPFKTNLTI